MEENRKVLLGMSGGTDSSVAAMLLQEAGYEVTGITFRFYERNGDTEYLDDARALAARLGMEHLVYDAREEFERTIVRYFVQEYLQAHTPVPCTLCNNYLKWPLLQRVADAHGIYHLATGHYVNKRFIDGYYHITCGADSDKDQSFFLWGLPQAILQRMLLPMGGLTKPQVRQYALERGFEKAARKKDSLGVCFCPMDYRTFLRGQVSGEERELLVPGNFYNEDGQPVGKHDGFPFYTIGQRRGLGLQQLNKAVFVKEIDPATNRVVVAPYASLEKQGMLLKEWNVTNKDSLLGRDDVIVKIRYRKQANRCTVTVTSEGLLRVELHEPLAAIAPGQAAAFYRDEVVLGGGIIVEAW